MESHSFLIDINMQIVADSSVKAETWWIPVDVGTGEPARLEANIYKPPGDGPFPLVSINHGVPRDESNENLRKTRLRFTKAARWFTDRGFAVVVPLRRGFGHSDGDFSEKSGPCDRRDYIAEGVATSIDMLNAVRYMQNQSFVDPERVVIVGQSAGGLGALTIATAPPDGVVGVVSFAGARGSKEPGMVCSEANLISSMAALGAKNKLPGLWLFSENDRYFGPELARKLFASYADASIPPVTFVRLPSFGVDGHRTLYDADPLVWSAPVSSFLRRLKL